MEQRYVIYIRYWFGVRARFISTSNLYEYVGKMILSSLNHIERIDFKELKTIDDEKRIREYLSHRGVEVN